MPYRGLYSNTKVLCLTHDLARKGIVVRQKNALLIKDLERLEDMVEEVRGE